MVKILVTNSRPGYTSTTILYNKKKFKIVCDNGNCYSNLKIEMYCQIGLTLIAIFNDIPGAKYINYCSSNEIRIKEQEENIKLAIEYIKLIF